MTAHETRVGETVFRVSATGREHTSLGPVAVAVYTGSCSVSEYLSPDRAREVAAALVAVADQVDGPKGCPHDEICQTCTAAYEDDVCLPLERVVHERDHLAAKVTDRDGGEQ